MTLNSDRSASELARNTSSPIIEPPRAPDHKLKMGVFFNGRAYVAVVLAELVQVDFGVAPVLLVGVGLRMMDLECVQELRQHLLLRARARAHIRMQLRAVDTLQVVHVDLAITVSIQLAEGLRDDCLASCVQLTRNS